MTIEQIKAELDRMKADCEPKRMGDVSVDAGMIAFSADGDLNRAHETYCRIQDVCCQTARVVCEDGRGGISTGADGDYEVVRVPMMRVPHHVLLMPEGTHTLTLGDCGRVNVVLPINGARSVSFAFDGATLWVSWTPVH